MYNLTAAISKESGKELSDAQLSQLSKGEEYLKKHKIHEICNVRLTQCRNYWPS